MKYKSGGIIRENDPDGISEVTRGVRSHKNGINGGNTQLQALFYLELQFTLCLVL
jgi:hypothetical protein